MKISTVTGDLAQVTADAICTSTNPRLSLAMGTGGSVRERAGFEVLRECEAIVRASGGRVPPGSACVTSPGALPVKALIHCVASDEAHRSSAAIIRSCVTNALACADARDCRSVAMPVFAPGHAPFKFDVPPGSACVTSPGALPVKALIHCVASDEAHQRLHRQRIS